jgi:hypothetical protein
MACKDSYWQKTKSRRHGPAAMALEAMETCEALRPKESVFLPKSEVLDGDHCLHDGDGVAWSYHLGGDAIVELRIACIGVRTDDHAAARRGPAGG